MWISRHACTRSAARQIATLLVFCLLVSMLLPGAMSKGAWADERIDESASDVVDDEAHGGGDEVKDEPVSGQMSSGSVEVSNASDWNEQGRSGIDELVALRAKLANELAQIDSAKAAFSAARSGFSRSMFSREAMSRSEANVQERENELADARHETLVLVKMIQDELMQSEDYATHAIMTGLSTPHDIARRQDMLERLLIAEGTKIRELVAEQRRLRVIFALDTASARHERLQLRSLIQPVNEAAYKLERRCSTTRQCMEDIRHAIAEMREDIPSYVELRDSILSAIEAADSVVSESERELGGWYDELDARAGLSDVISFGEGVDFALSEDDFVDIWGTAIDEFFESRAKTTGPMPLQSYGRTMASSAYRHRVDPRLCAAVSIAESSGGQRCIRACNAWGWGAADSDPYELAVEWDSFEEAIEAWHEGVATSTSGLATAASVSSLGAIYCSMPSWGAAVIDQMELISSFV